MMVAYWLQVVLRDELGGWKTHLAPGSKRQEEESQQAIAQRAADIAAQQEADGDFDSAEVVVSDLLNDLDMMEIRAENARRFAEELDAIFEGSGTKKIAPARQQQIQALKRTLALKAERVGVMEQENLATVQQPDPRAESADQVQNLQFRIKHLFRAGAN